MYTLLRYLYSYTHPPQPPISHQPTAQGDVERDVRGAFTSVKACQGEKNGQLRSNRILLERMGDICGKFESHSLSGAPTTEGGSRP